MMRKENRVKKTFNNSVETTIERFYKLKPTDRFDVLEQIGEWIFCEYDELELDYLKHKQFRGSTNE